MWHPHERSSAQARPRRWPHLAVALLLAVFATGCVKSCAAGRLCQTACTEEGRCDVRFTRAGDAPYRCYAGSDRDCAASDLCADRGRCFATEQGECVVESEVEHHACADSIACSLRGQCGHRSGICWADDDAGCEASFECRTQGRCSARAGVCVATSDADCEASVGCEVEGLCSLRSFMGAGSCGVDLDDPSECAASWVCEHRGRCAPATPPDCEGCRYGYCAAPGEPGDRACTIGAHNVPGCSRDGRCAPNEDGECVHAPVGGPGAVASNRDGAANGAAKDEAGRAVAPNGPAPASPNARPPATPRPPTPVPRPSIDREPPEPDLTPPVPPPGPGAVAYDIDDIEGHAYDGVLMHASLLTGVTGLEAGRAVDLLTLRTMPGESCYPRAGGFHPLDAIWLLGAFPASEGTFTFDGGPMPGQMSGKTWLWTGSTSRSYNLALHGTITVESRTADEVRGHVAFRVTDYFSDDTIGTVRGPFVAEILDCATWDRWPM